MAIRKDKVSPLSLFLGEDNRVRRLRLSFLVKLDFSG
jgi:hypothetical protein